LSTEAGGALAGPVLDGRLSQRVLAELVETPSVNPGVFEADVARVIGRWLEPVAEVHYVETFPGRPSVAAVLSGTGGGRRLVLNGHMDTVPVDGTGWMSDPFTAEVRDGFLYGRGACDMKGGLAAQITVAHALAREKARLRGDLILHFAAGEECGEPGTLSLCEAGFVGDAGIVTEPTELQVSVATRGLAVVHIRIQGRSIHASKAQLGVNPVRWAPAVLAAMEDYEADVATRDHSLLGHGSCTPTVVRAGVKENAVPDYCDISFDRRLIPGETVEGELEDVRSRLEAVRRAHPGFEYELWAAPYPFAPAEVPSDSQLALDVQRVTGEVLGKPPRIIGTAYSSDVRNLVNDAGMEAITFGPGNVAECHCVNERVRLDQVRDAARVLARFAREYLA
jgi:succinyl-diaminopimelate desuccinylase